MQQHRIIMVKLEITEKQAYLIMDALDLYSRIGMGQFDKIKGHPTIQNNIWDNHRDEYHDFADKELMIVRNKLFDISYGLNGSQGIHSTKIDDTNRLAFDIKQVIRHEFWKCEPNRSSMTVDSHIHFTSTDGESCKIKCEVIK